MPRKDAQIEYTEISQSRIFNIQVAAAEQLARSFSLCHKKPSDLKQRLWNEEQIFNRKLARITELTVESIDKQAFAIDLKEPTIIISHHVPIDTAIPIPIEQFLVALRSRGDQYLIQGLSLEALQIVSVHEGVLASVMEKVFPHYRFEFAKIQAGLDTEPIHSIQKNDGSIILPYGENNAGGVEILSHGIKSTFEQYSNTIVTGFPDVGRPRPTIEKLLPFRTGIFAAASKVAAETGKTITVLPIVYGVNSDFGIRAQVLSPNRITPSVYDSINREPIRFFTNSIDTQIRTAYQALLLNMPNGYFWKGIQYPYGGLTGEQIKTGFQSHIRRS